MLSKKTIELDKLKKPTKGRPKNKFISYKDFWCLPYGSYCDEARTKNKCREEAPKHSMPSPFNDFDCQHYIKIPSACLLLKPEVSVKLMTLAIKSLFENLFGLVNCLFSIKKLETLEEEKIYRITFVVNSYTNKNQKQCKNIILRVNLSDEIVTLEC